MLSSDRILSRACMGRWLISNLGPARSLRDVVGNATGTEKPFLLHDSSRTLQKRNPYVRWDHGLEQVGSSVSWHGTWWRWACKAMVDP